MSEKFCHNDKEKICDESCIAYNPNGFSIVREPYYDRSRVVPEWMWLALKAHNAIVCKSGGFTIEIKDEIKPPLEE